MKVSLDQEADEELSQATAYLAARSEEAALGFLEEIAEARRRLLDFPHIGAPIAKKCRRLLLKRFPYQLVYRVEESVIRIYAIAHLKRRPRYWRKRVKP